MMNTRNKLFTFIYYLLTILFGVEGNYSYLFCYLDLRQLAYLLFASAHHILEEINILFIKVNILQLSHML